MEKKIDKSMYYSANNTLSKNRLFNFVVGPRGVGKTYGAKKRAMENWLKHGKQFIYLRRYQTEMPQAEMKAFFADVGQEYPEFEWSVHNGVFRCDKDTIGWYFPLSKSQMLKSVPFPKVDLIIFDEFIINTGVYHYLPNEVTTFLECYSTISRDRDVQVLFLSNAVTFSNHYFIYFDLSLEPGQRIKMTKDISLEYVESRVFNDHMSNTRFGRMIKGTRYGDYAIDNKVLLDTDIFVEKMTNPCSYVCTFVFDSVRAGFYRDNITGNYFLSENVDGTCRYVMALSSEQHNTETQLLSRSNLIFKTLFDSYAEGKLRFETQRLKSAASAVLKSTL